jgi:hypothetical protein
MTEVLDMRMVTWNSELRWRSPLTPSVYTFDFQIHATYERTCTDRFISSSDHVHNHLSTYNLYSYKIPVSLGAKSLRAQYIYTLVYMYSHTEIEEGHEICRFDFFTPSFNLSI